MDSADNAANASLASQTSGLDKPRLSFWALLALFSALALTAHETDDQNKGSGHNLWILICSSISLSFGILSLVAHVTGNVLASVFVGTIFEGLIALALVGMWAGCLPVVMDPSYGLGQMYVGRARENAEDNADYQAVISNANLYFTTWGAAICALSILAMFVREKLGGGRSGGGMGYTAKWYLLMLASVVVIIESMRFKNDVCSLEGGTDDRTCARNTYGIATGAVGLGISFLVSLFSSLGKDSALITTAASFVMAILYTVCAGLLTFDNGPATYVGNHYFSAWAGFFMSFMVFGSVMKEFLGVGASRDLAGGSGESGQDMEMNNI